MSDDALGPRLARNSLFTGIGLAVSLIAGFVVSPLLLDGLGDRAFGVWVLGVVVGLHLQILCELGGWTALTYRIAAGRARREHGAVGRAIAVYLMLTAATGTLGLLLFLPLAQPLANMLGLPPEFGFELLILAALCGAARPFFFVWDSILKGYERFDLASGFTTARALVWFVVAVAIVRYGGGARALIAAEGLVMVAIFIPGSIVAWRCLRRDGERLLHRPSRDDWRQQWSYGTRIYASSLTDLLQAHSDKILIGGLLSPLGVKSYELGQKIILPARVALGGLARVLIPAIPGLGESAGQERLQRLHRISQKALIAAGFAGLAVLIGAAPTLLRAWLGPSHVEDEMVLALRLLAIGYALDLVTLVPLQIARGMSQLRVEVRSALLISIVGLGLKGLLLYLWGLPGLLCGVILTFLVVTGYRLIAFAPLLGYQPLAHLRRTTMRPALAALVAGGALALCEHLLATPALLAWLGARGPFIARLLIEAPLFLLVWLVGGRLCGLFDEDARLILSLIRGTFRGPRASKFDGHQSTE